MKSTKAALPVLLSALAMLTGCQSVSTRSAAIDAAGAAPFCAVTEPILYSRNDTLQTQLQVREHNAVGVALGCSGFLATAKSQEGLR